MKVKPRTQEKPQLTLAPLYPYIDGVAQIIYLLLVSRVDGLLSGLQLRAALGGIRHPHAELRRCLSLQKPCQELLLSAGLS